MSRLQSIENELSTINGAVFQELCDSFLAIRNRNYSAFSRTGSQSGKQKTIKGTPDSFLLLPNGKYIFVEYSTNISAGISKLKDDINKCVDTSKTGIPVNQISEIIICINFNIKAIEIKQLQDLLLDTRIILTIYTLDSLAIELHLNHRDLTNEYLGLPLDTGQIVSIERFINEYNRASKGISTPLDNEFLHRENELEELKNSIKKNDFVILTGAPGVGKTKLALESISDFLKEFKSYKAFCVSYKNHTLLDDLYQYFNSDEDYLLFVDDANRIDAFSQITGFYKSSRKGKLKIIITVRDYAFQEIGVLCQEFSPKRIDLNKFTDEQIVDIIKTRPFEILNPDYQKIIIKIADGNPRLAIMATLLAKAEQNIYALSDVSDLFEKYFSTFIKDDGEFANSLNIKCLGIISFFYTIPYKNKEITNSILEKFNIIYSEFIDVIDKLDKLELVDIQFEHVKIPEQNLATYFFYKAFIKDDLLSFQILLNDYFDNNHNRFTDSVIPANNTFGPTNVMDKLKPELQLYWKKINADNEKSITFLSTFWYYLQAETLEYIYKIIEELPEANHLIYDTTYETNDFAYEKETIIDLLGNFFRFSTNLKDVIELAFEYIRKKPEHLPELIHKIRETLIFDSEDENFHFQRQNILFEILINGTNNNDILYLNSFFELSKTFLNYKFQHTKGGRNHSIYFYSYPIPNNQLIQGFRKKIWDTLDSKFKLYQNESFNLLENYSRVSPDVNKDIMEYDVPFVLNIIEKHLKIDSFEHCKYVQSQIRWFIRSSISSSKFPLLQKKYTNETYETFLKLDWDRYRDKEMFEYNDYREYEKLKEAEIRSSFIFNSPTQVNDFYKTFYYLKNSSENSWNYNNTLDIIIDKNSTIDFEIGCDILLTIIKNDNEIDYVPRAIFRNQLKTKEQAKTIWSIIQSKIFKSKILWELSFYDYLDDSLINEDYVNYLINTVSSIDQQKTIHFDRLQRYLKVEPNLFQIILRKIYSKNEKENTRIQVWMDFFSQHYDQLGSDFDLIEKAYLQQEKIQNHFDYEGKGFLKILDRNPNFLVEYINSIYSNVKFGLSGDHRDLGFIWQIKNIEPVLEKVFKLVIIKEPYLGIRNHFCNSFFRNLNGEFKIKAEKFILDYAKTYNLDYKKMNVVVDIVRHSLKEMFEIILVQHISLNQNVELFDQIWWRGNGGTYSGDVIISDIEASEWRNILSIIEKADLGIKSIPIKKRVNEKIEFCLRSGDRERQRRFLQRF